MEIIEKQTFKEVSPDCGDHKNLNGKANAGLTLGIIGTALGALGIWGNNGGGGLFGGRSGYGAGPVNINSYDKKIILSAMNFWFMDEDYKKGNKIWLYFNCK